MPQLF